MHLDLTALNKLQTKCIATIAVQNRQRLLVLVGCTYFTTGCPRNTEICPENFGKSHLEIYQFGMPPPGVTTNGRTLTNKLERQMIA